jgi:hypothetical protein
MNADMGDIFDASASVRFDEGLVCVSISLCLSGEAAR